jgi:hypothetical protein
MPSERGRETCLAILSGVYDVVEKIASIYCFDEIGWIWNMACDSCLVSMISVNESLSFKVFLLDLDGSLEPVPLPPTFTLKLETNY